MGLETVRQQVQTLKGKVTVVSRPGGGTTFTLVLPLTLTITNLLVFSVNNNLLASPVDTLAAIATASRSQVQKIRGKLFYRSQEQLIPLYTQSVFNYNYPLQTEFLELPQGLAVTKAGKIPLLLLSHSSQVIALAVEQVLMEQELVIKPFGSAIAPPPYLYGCTILPDGRLVPVIDSRALLELITSKSSTQQSKSKSDKKALPPIPPVPTVMVIDDSLTIQETMFLTLRKAGYRVIKAHDGREALKQLRRYPGIQVVICDIEMPGMNGFEFLSHCRQAFPNRHLPIIILTSRSGEKHRQLAKHLGAFAYLTKPCLKQELLSTLKSSLQQQSSTNSPSN
jgi:chemotaxis family two-component system sensor histidine kinase/response regulator PixL